jgi:hypothetical protein
MIFQNNKKINPAARTGWVAYKRGYEVTQSTVIIDHCLRRLKNDGVMVVLYAKGYQSQATIIYAVQERQILIDKPKDWPEVNKIKVVFRDGADLWNHFSAPVLSVLKDGLCLRKPTEMFMLQRRTLFRVTTPRGSKATFVYNKKKCKFKVLDISAGGMLVSTAQDHGVDLYGKTIKEILITLPGDSGTKQVKEKTVRFTVPEGKVVRSMKIPGTDQEQFGIRLFAAPKEERRIFQYIRQRELQVMRKSFD